VGPNKVRVGTNESLQRLLVQLVAFVNVDGPPDVALQTGIEEPCRVLQRRGETYKKAVKLTFASGWGPNKVRVGT
jgi:hypothetical protein